MLADLDDAHPLGQQLQAKEDLVELPPPDLLLLTSFFRVIVSLLRRKRPKLISLISMCFWASERQVSCSNMIRQMLIMLQIRSLKLLIFSGAFFSSSLMLP